MNDVYTQDGKMDKNLLWQRYLPLVRHEALKLQVRLPASVELDDLIQAGSIGLLNAVDRFDAQQGASFSTYAVQRIKGSMLDELRARDWAPRSVRRQAREVSKGMQLLEQQLGRNATEQEVAQHLQLDLADYRQILTDTNSSQLFSYEEWHENYGESCEPVIEVDDEQNPLQTLVVAEIRQRVIDAIECLPEREKWF